MRGLIEENNMEVRALQIKEIKEALELCKEVREHHRAFLNGYFTELDEDSERNALMNMLESERDCILVAVQDNHIVGLIQTEWKVSPHLEKSQVAYIHNLVVSKKCQGQGVGHQLMDALMTRCKKRGIEEIKLGVFNENKSAYAFYEHYGFKPLEQKMNLMVK